MNDDEPELLAAAAMHKENVQAVQRILISKSIMQEQPFQVTLRIARDGMTTSVCSVRPLAWRYSTRVPCSPETSAEIIRYRRTSPTTLLSTAVAWR